MCGWRSGWPCSAPNCVKEKTRDARLFRFPTNAERRKRWVVNCRWNNWTPTETSRLCEAHFEESQYEQHRADGKKKLKWNAVPTLFSISNPPKLLALTRKQNIIDRRKQPVLLHNDHLYVRKISNTVRRISNTVRKISNTGKNNVSQLKTEKQPMSFNFNHSTEAQPMSFNFNHSNESTSSPDRYPHIYPSNYNDFPVDATTNAVNETQTRFTNAGNESQIVVELARKVKHLQRQLRCEKEKVIQFGKNLNRLFNEDQIRWLRLNPGSVKAMKWSNETIKSSLKVLCATGVKGYAYLLRLGFPLPSYKTLCNRVDNAQFQPGIHHEIFEFLNINFDSLPSVSMACILAIDEMRLEPNLQFDKGTKYTEEVRAALSSEIREELESSTCDTPKTKSVNTITGVDKYKAVVSDTIVNPENKRKRRSLNVSHKSVAKRSKFVEHSYNTNRFEGIVSSISQSNIRVIRVDSNGTEVNQNGCGNEYVRSILTQAPIPGDESMVIPSVIVGNILCTSNEKAEDQRSNSLISSKGLYPTSYVCTTCGLIATTKTRLHMHIRTHSLERPYKCTVCIKSFTTSSNLNRHIYIHTGLRPHLCHLCGKGFVEKTMLKDHMLAHCDEKTHACKHCGRLFKRIATLRIHVKYAHNGPAAVSIDDNTTAPIAVQRKRFLCDICNRSFSSASWLRLHGKIHRGERPYECKTCNKSFVQKQQLDQHERVHSGVRPFSCIVCGKSFIYKYILHRHVKTHSIDKPFLCTNCGKGYCQASNLKNHMLTHS